MDAALDAYRRHLALHKWRQVMDAQASVGVTPKFHQGAHAVYRLLAGTPYAAETPEAIDGDRTLREAARTYLNHLPME